MRLLFENWWWRILAMVRPGVAFQRFPVAAAAVSVATVLALLVANKNSGFYNSNLIFDLIIASFCFGLAGFSASLFGERHNWPAAQRLAISLIAGVPAALIFWFGEAIDLLLGIYLTALVFAVAVVPFLGSRRDDAGYWAFNHDLWVASAYAGIALFILGGGLSLILSTIDYLFLTRLMRALVEEIWIIAACFVAPIVWLSLAPVMPLAAHGSSAERATLVHDQVVFAGVITLVRNLLIPLILAYTVILYAYAAKIGLVFELPKGKIGWMVSGFAAAGVLTGLMAWPIRETGGSLVRFFWRFWFALTLVPLVLLCVGLIERISTYNLTPGRYVLVLIGLWLAIVAVAFSFSEKWRDLRIITGSLLAFLVISMAGPFNITGFPAGFLEAELKATFAGAGMLDGSGHMRAAPQGGLSTKQQARVGSVINTLYESGQLNVLGDMASGELREKLLARSGTGFRLGERRAPRASVLALVDHIGLERRMLYRHSQRQIENKEWHSYYHGGMTGRYNVDGATALIGPFSVSPTRDMRLNVESDNVVEMSLAGESVEFTFEKQTFTFSFAEVADVIAASPHTWQPKNDPAGAARLGIEDPSRTSALIIASGNGKARLLVTHVSIHTQEGVRTIRNLSCWVLIDKVE